MANLVRNNQLQKIAPEVLYPIAVNDRPLSIYRPAVADAPLQDTYAKTAAIAAMAVFGLCMMALIGVMIGRGDRHPIASHLVTPSPQIVVVPQASPDRSGCQILCFGGK